MRPTLIDCPHCASTHQFTLRSDADRHLRQCPDCTHWFVFSETTDEGEVQPLGDPATCPVPDCEEAVRADTLPQHIIAEHDASLDPGSESAG